MMIPAGLKKKLPEAESEGLVINRGFKKYLVIYTKKEWDKKVNRTEANLTNTKKETLNL